MKNMTKCTLVFTFLALPLSLAISGCGHNPPQTDNMTSHSVTTNAVDNMTPPQMVHMESNSMHTTDSSMNNMAPNDVNMAHSPQAGHMMSGSMTTDVMHNMTPSQVGHMESNSMHMAGSSMNNMASNSMNMAHLPQTGHMMSGSMTASNQSQMNGMTTNSMHKMAAAQTGNLELH